MIIIKNYYDQQRELEIAYLRLKTLEEQKQLYFGMTQPGAAKPKEVVVKSSGTNDDPFFKYVLKVEQIENSIFIKKCEINVLEKNLKYMEENIRKMKSIEYKVFTAKYIDGLPVKQIAKKVGYSEPQIYRILNIIKQIIQERRITNE